MLTHLTIQNYALISHLDIAFGSGLSVLTGETGAGKSIILGALNLVMGGRADSKAITDGEQKCIIEAEFDISSCNLEAFFRTNELEYDYTCIIRRELFNTGKSRSFVNDSLVGLQVLKELSRRLIDIHSQHENLLLGDNLFQLCVVDTIAQNEEKQIAYRQAFDNYTNTAKELAKLQMVAQKAHEDTDYITFQYNQLKDANIQPNELEELESEAQLLAHAEDIKSALVQINESINGDAEQNILSVLKTDIQSCTKVESYIPLGKEFVNRLQSTYIELKDLADEVNRVAERTEFDPQRMQFVNERLDVINALLQKHHLSHTQELIDLQKSLKESLLRLDSFDGDILRLQKKLETEKMQLQQASKALTQSRVEVVDDISQQMVKGLKELGIYHAKIQINITELEDFTENGKDDIQFMFAANLNQSLQKMSDVASGGEMSRIMLCIKSLIAGTKELPTIIFDEIDTGISGEIAKKMGNLMQQIARSRQVLSITHLPQIAAQGNTQYEVYKFDTDTRTETNIRCLSSNERVEAIAHMLAGKDISDIARKNAKELLQINNAD